MRDCDTTLVLVEQLNGRTEPFKVSEVAKFLRIDRSSVYEMIEAGVLHHYRFGPNSGSIRVDPAQLREYLLRHNSATVEPARAVPAPVRR